jgi:hypothetical protein
VSYRTEGSLSKPPGSVKRHDELLAIILQFFHGPQNLVKTPAE